MTAEKVFHKDLENFSDRFHFFKYVPPLTKLELCNSLNTTPLTLELCVSREFRKIYFLLLHYTNRCSFKGLTIFAKVGLALNFIEN